LDGITDREREVLTLIARGLANAEIAHALHVTVATAKTHVRRLLANSAPATAPSSSWSR
jgi:ATP/maltotriose-dependent transcriptional regulator MalT